MRAGSLAAEAPGEHWLFEGLWGRTAIGLIGGVPKCCKSWLGLELAVTLASGTDALDHFPAVAQGPALVFRAEDALPQVRLFEELRDLSHSALMQARCAGVG